MKIKLESFSSTYPSYPPTPPKSYIITNYSLIDTIPPLPPSPPPYPPAPPSFPPPHRRQGKILIDSNKNAPSPPAYPPPLKNDRQSPKNMNNQIVDDTDSGDDYSSNISTKDDSTPLPQDLNINNSNELMIHDCDNTELYKDMTELNKDMTSKKPAMTDEAKSNEVDYDENCFANNIHDDTPRKSKIRKQSYFDEEEDSRFLIAQSQEPISIDSDQNEDSISLPDPKSMLNENDTIEADQTIIQENDTIINSNMQAEEFVSQPLAESIVNEYADRSDETDPILTRIDGENPDPVLLKKDNDGICVGSNEPESITVQDDIDVNSDMQTEHNVSLLHSESDFNNNDYGKAKQALNHDDIGNLDVQGKDSSLPPLFIQPQGDKEKRNMQDEETTLITGLDLVLSQKDHGEDNLTTVYDVDDNINIQASNTLPSSDLEWVVIDNDGSGVSTSSYVKDGAIENNTITQVQAEDIAAVMKPDSETLTVLTVKGINGDESQGKAVDKREYKSPAVQAISESSSVNDNYDVEKSVLVTPLISNCSEDDQDENLVIMREIEPIVNDSGHAEDTSPSDTCVDEPEPESKMQSMLGDCDNCQGESSTSVYNDESKTESMSSNNNSDLAETLGGKIATDFIIDEPIDGEEPESVEEVETETFDEPNEEIEGTNNVPVEEKLDGTIQKIVDGMINDTADREEAERDAVDINAFVNDAAIESGVSIDVETEAVIVVEPLSVEQEAEFAESVVQIEIEASVEMEAVDSTIEILAAESELATGTEFNPNELIKAEVTDKCVEPILREENAALLNEAVPDVVDTPAETVVVQEEAESTDSFIETFAANEEAEQNQETVAAEESSKLVDDLSIKEDSEVKFSGEAATEVIENLIQENFVEVKTESNEAVAITEDTNSSRKVEIEITDRIASEIESEISEIEKVAKEIENELFRDHKEPESIDVKEVPVEEGAELRKAVDAEVFMKLIEEVTVGEVLESTEVEATEAIENPIQEVALKEKTELIEAVATKELSDEEGVTIDPIKKALTETVEQVLEEATSIPMETPIGGEVVEPIETVATNNELDRIKKAIIETVKQDVEEASTTPTAKTTEEVVATNIGYPIEEAVESEFNLI